MIWPTNSITKYIKKKINENICPCKNVYMNVCNDQKVKTIQMRISWWICKEKWSIYMDAMELLNWSMKWSTDTCCYMDATWKHDAVWKKLDIKGYILYGPIYVNGLGKFIDTERRWVAARGWGKGNGECLLRDMRFLFFSIFFFYFLVSFWSDENSLELVVIM